MAGQDFWRAFIIRERIMRYLVGNFSENLRHGNREFTWEEMLSPSGFWIFQIWDTRSRTSRRGLESVTGRRDRAASQNGSFCQTIKRETDVEKTRKMNVKIEVTVRSGGKDDNG